MRIIPAIDIIEGKCVRLSQGDYSTKKIYNEDPLEVALAFQDAGINYLHLVDLDGAKAKHIINWKVLERLASNTELKIDFGGGLKSDGDLRIAFECGASQIIGGSVAVKEPVKFASWIMKYDAERIILGADAKEGKIAVTGWEEDTDREIIDFISEYVKKGIQYVISTDIAKDGMLGGPSFALYQAIMEQVQGIKLFASGGISKMDELFRLEEEGLEGVIIGKAIYEKKITLDQLKEFHA